jgi:zinc transporter 1/2/3
MTPFGSLIGVLITVNIYTTKKCQSKISNFPKNMDMDELLKDGMIVVLESLAGGTFIYVTFFEVLAQERANNHSNLIQLCAIVIGFLVISALQINESMSEKA